MALTELLKPQKNGQFLDEPVRKNKSRTNSLCNRTDVLAIEGKPRHCLPPGGVAISWCWRFPPWGVAFSWGWLFTSDTIMIDLSHYQQGDLGEGGGLYVVYMCERDGRG